MLTKENVKKYSLIVFYTVLGLIAFAALNYVALFIPIEK